MKGIERVSMTTTREQILTIASEVLRKEAEAILTLRESLDDSFFQTVELLSNCKGKAVLIGVGKSGHVGRKVAATLASLGTPAFFVHAGEAIHGDFGMITAQDIAILISHSGETAEVLALVETIRKIGSKIITITGKKDCSLARHADVALVTDVTEEADPLNLAPTSSSTATLALGDALAVTLAQVKRFSKKDFRVFHPGGALGKRLAQGS